ncbi:hypothetical protein [Arthrobacter sp. 7Tela_A1]|uniref:hypothetical protein n=1 Tax=Arthrobacter sp. 7Tela_A1 TaxID=3093745 RepID=UPI003BB71F8E
MARPTILDRFRPVGAPGPSGPVGVPSADDEGTAAELLPVFEALKPDVEAARQLLEAAGEQARTVLAGARRQADADVAQARLDSGAVRARAAEQVSQAAAVRDQERLDQARQRAASISEGAAGRITQLAERIAASVVQDYLGPDAAPRQGP